MNVFRISTLFVLVVLASCGSREPSASSHSANELQCLSEALYFEARGTGDVGYRAVAEVIVNRRDDSRFPDTVCGVVDQRYNGSCQFSYRCLAGPLNYSEPVELELARSAASSLLAGEGEEITNGALFFHAAWAEPGWFGTLHRTGQFGGNIFYK